MENPAMKNFSVTLGKKPIDWNEWLDKPFNKITHSEMEEMSSLAASWVTCATGNLCVAIPRSLDNKEPYDNKLRSLGFDFNERIRCAKDEYFYTSVAGFNCEREEAKKILVEIEKRSAFLLSRMMDSNGNILMKGSMVFVPEPIAGDTHLRAFIGEVHYFTPEAGNAVVIDHAHLRYEFDSKRLTLKLDADALT